MIQFARRWLRRRPRTLASLDAYALWAASYPPRAHNTLMEVEQAAMLDLMPPLDGCVVIDLACGTGRYGLLAQSRGARQVIGLDNSPAMLAANPLSGRALATSEAIPLRGGSADALICALALGHLPNLLPSLGEIARVLQSGGAALISDVHPFIALRGDQRTFRAPDGRAYAVEHHTHLYADYQRAAASAGLEIDALAEPTYDGVPIVIVFRLYRRALSSTK